MHELLSPIGKSLLNLGQSESHFATAVPGVHCLKVSQTSRRAKTRWRSCLAIVAQGCKEVVLGQRIYRCSEGHFTATPIELPVISRFAEASELKPFLGILVELRPAILVEIATQMEPATVCDGDGGSRAFFTGKATEAMLVSVARLVNLLGNTEQAPILGPLVVKELLYHFLCSPEGTAIRQFVRGGKMHKISRVIHKLRSDLADEIDVVALAKDSNMSRSAFFKHFKDVTSMSPIQYQKRLRLLEAKRLMLEESETAEGSAFRVGYKSASQFNREYSRMFGSSPRRDVQGAKSRV